MDNNNETSLPKRVIGKTAHSYNSKTDEHTETHYQYLQERKDVKLFGKKLFSYWKTIDTEEVPSYAWIQMACFGSTDWKSKWFGIPNVLWVKVR